MLVGVGGTLAAHISTVRELRYVSSRNSTLMMKTMFTQSLLRLSACWRSL